MVISSHYVMIMKLVLVCQTHHTIHLSQKISYAHNTTFVHIYSTAESYV